MAEGRQWYKAMPFVCAALARHIYHCLKFNDPYDVEKAFQGSVPVPASEEEWLNLGASLEEKVAQISEALKAEGILDTWTREADSFRLLNSSCPYRRAAEATTGPCRLDRLAIQLLLGVPVEQVGRVIEGHPYCEYVVRPRVVTRSTREGRAASGQAGRKSATARAAVAS
jgi:hypothetical protein